MSSLNSGSSKYSSKSRYSILEIEKDKKVQRMLERIEGPRKKPTYEVAANFANNLRKHPKSPRTRAASHPRPTSSPRITSSPAKKTAKLMTFNNVDKENAEPNSHSPHGSKSHPVINVPPPRPAPAPRKMQQVLGRINPGQQKHFNVCVGVRIRPLAQREADHGRLVMSSSNEVIVGAKRFAYNHVFDNQPQSAVFEAMGRPQLESLLEGYNTSLFGYGQTGSGKTFTMMGIGTDQGIVPRFNLELFVRLKELTDTKLISASSVEVAFFEVYNERIYDLLIDDQQPKQQSKPKPEAFARGPTRPKASKPTLKVRGTDDNIYVEGLTWHTITGSDEADKLLARGNARRATASTGMNDQSSRSHSICQIRVQINSNDLKVQRNIKCTASLIDLAGSERSSTAQTTGRRLREGSAINQSLLTLGKIIKTLAEGETSRKGHIPYRDSVLTHILKHSLGGNSKTAIIAAVSPSTLNKEETLSTLNYAQVAQMIVNTAQVNEEVKSVTIRQLQDEIEELRARNLEQANSNQHELEAEIERLKMEQDRDKAEWARAQAESEQKYAKALEAKINVRSNPHLINVSKDPSLTGLHTIILPIGITTVGNTSRNIVVMRGSMINENHATIETNEAGLTTIEPTDDSVIVVNGDKITAPHQLLPNDRVIFGLNHYFVYRAAHCANDQQVVDFAQMNLEYLEKQKVEHKRELERRKREIEREKEEIKMLYAEQFECSTHSVINDPNFLQLLDDVVGCVDEQPASLGSVTEELGQLLTKITEANAVTKSSNIRFEFGFQSEDTRYVMVIRGEKYKTYWDEAYFLDMLETIILNAGSAEAETIILARGAEDEWEALDAAPIGASIMELSSRGHDMTNEERGKLRRTLSRRLSSMVKRMGKSAQASALGESSLMGDHLDGSVLVAQSHSIVSMLEATLSDLLSPRHDVQGHLLSVGPPMRLIVKLYRSLTVPSPEIDFGDIMRLANLSCLLIVLRSESGETQNVVKRVIESRDALVSLIVQLAKAQEISDDELVADFSNRSTIKLLDLAKVLGCLSLLNGDDFHDTELTGNDKILQAFQKGTQRGTSKRLKKLRDRTVRHKTNDATLLNLNEYVSNLITEISTAQEDHDVASQTVQKSIAKTMPAVVEALSDLNSATSNKSKTSCFREFRGAFKTAKKSIVPSDFTIQSSLCSAGDSLRNEQGITNAFNMIEVEIDGGINRWLDSTFASNISSMPPSM